MQLNNSNNNNNKLLKWCEESYIHTYIYNIELLYYFTNYNWAVFIFKSQPIFFSNPTRKNLPWIEEKIQGKVKEFPNNPSNLQEAFKLEVAKWVGLNRPVRRSKLKGTG